jgi:uroporphyrinogen decarboxylase
VADLETGERVLEETETTRLVRDGNGAVFRWIKGASRTPEHVAFLVQDRQSWQEHIRPRLLDTRLYERRIDFDLYQAQHAKCAREDRFLTCGVVGVFDLMSPLCGHEHLLRGMATDPAWIRDMVEVYSRVTIDLLELVFSRAGLPDGLWVWDDLGFKKRPFMSPAMYRELLFPGHRRLFAWARDRGLPVILHADGFVEPLLPHLIEAGIDCLQPLEVKAGMDLLKLKKNYGERIALVGGMDIRALIANDLEQVRAELANKIPPAMSGSGYVLQTDHSVPDQVNYETYKYFVERGLEMGSY